MNSTLRREGAHERRGNERQAGGRKVKDHTMTKFKTKSKTSCEDKLSVLDYYIRWGLYLLVFHNNAFKCRCHTFAVCLKLKT